MQPDRLAHIPLRSLALAAAASTLLAACSTMPVASPANSGTPVAGAGTASPGQTMAPDASQKPSAVPATPHEPARTPAASPAATPDAPAATPDAPAATPDVPAATPDVPAASPGAGPTWQSLARLRNVDEIVALVGFAGGYVVAVNEARGATAYFSVDGRSWQATRLSDMVDDCAGGRSADAILHTASASSQEVLLLGTQFAYTPDTCSGEVSSGVGGGTVAWSSSDGVTWQRSEAFGELHATASSAWPVPGGWEAALSNCCDFDTVWQTTGGSGWQETLRLAGTEDSGHPMRGAASADGVRLLSATRNDVTILLRSDDGADWEQLDVGGEAAWAQAVLPPISDRPGSWLVARGDDFDDTTILLSADLVSWHQSEAPGRRTVTAAATTTQGYVISAEYPCDVVVFFGIARHVSGCDAPRQRQYVSPDGITWTAITPRLEGPVQIADGPAGVLLVGVYSGRIWQLGP